MANGPDGPVLPSPSENVGGSRFYRGAGLGKPAAWRCPTCNTEHTTPLEAGCPVCLAEDARRETAVAGAVTGWENLAPHLLEGWKPVVNVTPLDEFVDQSAEIESIQMSNLTEQARQSLAAALAHFVEHGAPDETLLPKPVLIGWARELAGLSSEGS